MSANCIIFNLYPVHAILDAVATPASLATRYAVVVDVVLASFRNFGVIKGPYGERAAAATLSIVSYRNQPPTHTLRKRGRALHVHTRAYTRSCIVAFVHIAVVRNNDREAPAGVA